MSTYSFYRRSEKNGNMPRFYNPVDIPLDESDYFIKVEPKYVNKPKTLAYDLYGTTDLFWIFSYFNKETISDPIFDLKEGMYILVPERSRLLRYF